MKINWFSPLPPAKTGIADYALTVLPALQHHAEVVAWTNQSNWDSKIKQYAEVRHYQLDSMPWFEINQADCNIYHIGNNRDFHSDIWRVSRQCAGIVILHELKLHHFFGGLYQHWNDKEGYLDRMRQYYGVEGEKAGKLFWNHALSAEYMSENYPLTSLGLENTVGAIAHNLSAYNSLQEEDRFFLGYAPLPYIGNFPRSQTKTIAPDLPYRVIIFGHIGFNRRLEAFIEALSQFPARNRFRLDIYGELWDENYIINRIKELNLDRVVKLHGFVKEAVLDEALANSDLAINLRYPTMGEASASQLRIWSHALPSFVTKIGWYAQLPENAVSFVRPEHELEDIHRHLHSFVANPEKFREMGLNGRLILEQEHTPEAYAIAIVDFAKKVTGFGHCAVTEQLIERVGGLINFWLQPQIDDTNLRNISDAIHFLSV